jgi:hypothetical protein
MYGYAFYDKFLTCRTVHITSLLHAGPYIG